MKTIFYRHLVSAAAMLLPISLQALTATQVAGEAESAYAVWNIVPGAAAYEVTCDGPVSLTADQQLIRRYPDGIRADIPGLKPGEYTLSIRAVDGSGRVIDETTTPTVSVYPHVREGFAFTGGNLPGAYNADGTLREGADVLYVSAKTVNMVTLPVVKDKKGTVEQQTGLQNILSAIGKGFHKNPLVVRVIGTVTDTQYENLKDGNYLNLQGNNATDRRIENITIEGIGDDATLYGYGICFKRTRNIEIRNIGIMLFGDDAISMDTDNGNIWLHNIDFFYGRPGKDADQVKGDGSIDMKYRSTDITIAFNHFFDSGKVMGCGGTTGESENLRITFHHNWFDHADSRCPRLHYTTAHVYNNYYDGVPVYCIGNTTETSAFVEANYFRGVKRPMMISGQGTDSYDEAKGTYTLKGTFSGQDGGMTKAFDNMFAECNPKLVYQTQHPTQFDAWLVTSRDEQLPATAVSVKGSWAYNNFDTAPEMYESTPDAVADVPSIVTSRAGRVGRGDFKWKFDNAKDDEDHEVNAPLKAAVTGYQSQLVAIQGEAGFQSSGIVAIEADGNSDAEYFDLTGRRVAGDATTPGIYLKKQGGKITKVTVR